MAEKRERIRQKKRLRLRFGTDEPKRMAFTEDLSVRGLFVITGQPEKPGTKLLLQLYLPDGEEVVASGRVQWAKKVPANLVRVAKKGGMGVRLLSFETGEAAFRDFIAELQR